MMLNARAAAQLLLWDLDLGSVQCRIHGNLSDYITLNDNLSCVEEHSLT